MDSLKKTSHFPEYKIGTFIKENKNRFLCTVEIDGKPETCYIASSCRLENFIDLRRKQVLLSKNKMNNSSTCYSVLGVKHRRSYIILNTSWANRVIAEDIHRRLFSFVGERKHTLKEKNIDGYRSDLYIPETKTIIEIKSVISTSDTALFPTVFSERAIKQMKSIVQLLEKGNKVFLFIVALNPYVKKICLQKDSDLMKYLIICQQKGLVVKGFSCRLMSDYKPHIISELSVQFD